MTPAASVCLPVIRVITFSATCFANELCVALLFVVLFSFRPHCWIVRNSASIASYFHFALLCETGSEMFRKKLSFRWINCKITKGQPDSRHPKALQYVPKMFQKGSQTGPSHSKTHPRRPKTDPRRSKTPPGRSKTAQTSLQKRLRGAQSASA